MDGCAGSCRHNVPSCRQNRAAATPAPALFVDIGYGLTVSGSCPARPAGAGDRTWEPDRRLDGEPTHRADLFGLGMWLWGPPHPHTVPAVGRCACRMAALRSSPVPARTRIPNTGSQRVLSSGHDGRLCRLLSARCAVMPAKSGSGGSRTRPFYGYWIWFDGFRIVSGPALPDAGLTGAAGRTP